MSRDYHLALEAITLFAGAERVGLEKMSRLTDEIQKRTEDIEKIQRFLTAISAQTKDSKRVDFSNDPMMRDLTDEIIQICGLPQGVYSWKENGKVNEIEQLTAILNNHISQIESRITQKTTQLTQIQYETNDCVEIMSTMLKECRDMIKRVQDNINRSR